MHLVLPLNQHCRHRFCQGLIILAGMLYSVTPLAHPHSWVDLHTEIQGDQTQITGFKMQWTFDTMTSAYLLDGEDMSDSNRENTLQQLANSIMTNMSNGHYFTFFYENDIPVKYSLATNGMLRQEKMQLTLTFELPLLKPKLLSDKPLKLQIYDPSYYADLSWPSKNNIKLAPALARHCQLTLTEATPTSEQITYVMSLPVDSTRDDALGELFTQTATITCKPEQG